MSQLTAPPVSTTTATTTAATTAAITATGRATAAATVAAPVLLAASSAAWLADAADARAVLQMWAMVGFGLAMAGFARRLGDRAPRGAAVVLVLGIVGACGGAAYAAEVAMVGQFGIQRLNDLTTLSSVLVLQVPGLCFPLGLITAGVLLWRARLVPPALGVALVVGAALFPASRIPELPGLALAADLVLCLALVPVGLLATRATGPAVQGGVARGR